MVDGMIAIAEATIDRGYSPIFKQDDFYSEMCKRAETQRKPGETREQAFAKFMTTDEGSLLYRALKVTPPGEPVEKAAASPLEEGPAMKALRTKAEELRGENGKLTREQAFARAFEDPANRALADAAREENRRQQQTRAA
jgi:hypothetical protein